MMLQPFLSSYLYKECFKNNIGLIIPTWQHLSHVIQKDFANIVNKVIIVVIVLQISVKR